MTVNTNQKNEEVSQTTLTEALSALKAAELHAIRKKWQIKNCSTLKKAALIQRLAASIPILLPKMIFLYDERRLQILKVLAANNGVLGAGYLEIEEIEYFAKTGYTFCVSKDDEQFICIPADLLSLLKDIIHDPDLPFKIKRNTEWIKLTRGLVYYYGVVPHGTLGELLDPYTTVKQKDLLDYSYVINDAMEYYQEIKSYNNGYFYWEITDPDAILAEQESRKGLTYYPFTKDQLIEAGETDFVEQPAGSVKLIRLLMKEHQLSKTDAVEMTEDMVLHVKMRFMPAQIIQTLQTRLEFKDMEAVQRFLDGLTYFMNHTRGWVLKGHTPNELAEQERKALQSTPKGEVIDIKTGRKIGRNEPCPCGSGKKYKKCCGR